MGADAPRVPLRDAQRTPPHTFKLWTSTSKRIDSTANNVGFFCCSYRIATGSEDQKVMLWDLRKQQCVYTIPAHTNLISHVKFHGKEGNSV